MTTESNISTLPKDRVLEISDFDEDKQKRLRGIVEAWDRWIAAGQPATPQDYKEAMIPWSPAMQHVSLTCRHHPHLCWSTKNWGGIGSDGHIYLSRNIFFFGEFIDLDDKFNRGEEYSRVIYLDAKHKEARIAYECQCPGSDLIGLVPQ
jgi:TPR repeat protein